MLREETLNEYKKKYKKDKSNKIKERVLNKVQLIDLIQDKDTNLNQEFNITVKTHGITDQKFTGRCWAFAGLNIIREKVIEKCNLSNFELSGSYIAFYEKLERFNCYLERLIDYKKANKDLYDRDVATLLQRGITDGGYFIKFANLIDKYGIVPSSVFPETQSSSSTYELNQILSRLLRKFYIDLEKTPNEYDKLKDKYMEKVYTILTNIYSMPPEKFDFEYTDKDEKYHIDKNITPKEFYEKYIGIDLKNEYVEITSYQDDKIKYNNIYEEEDTSNISGEKNNEILNLPKDEFESLMLEQLKNNEPVYFYCSTTTKRINGIWVDLLERYGDIFDIDLTLDNNSILKTNGITNAHGMLIVGANVKGKKITKWKIENSWGNQYGINGYYIATNDWINKYVYRIVINKKLLSTKQLDILKQEKQLIKKWDLKL